jgi:hypothetical protein
VIAAAEELGEVGAGAVGEMRFGKADRVEAARQCFRPYCLADGLTIPSPPIGGRGRPPCSGGRVRWGGKSLF